MLTSTGAEPSNWHTWRGPEQTGSAAYANPPTRWSDTENVKWKVDVPGHGSATPIVDGERIFVLTAIPSTAPGAASEAEPANDGESRRSGRRGRRGGRDGGGFNRGGGFIAPEPEVPYQFVVLCYDRRTGDELWRHVAAEEKPHEAGHSTNTFASSSPVTDGQNLYVSFGSRGIFSYTLDGNLRWKAKLGRMQTRNAFGEGSSPALHGKTLVVPWDHEGQSFIAALDTDTGEIRWKRERDERTTWATPLITEHEGRTHVVTNGSKVRSYDLETGDLIWECGGQASNPIPSPIRYRDNVICMTGYRGYAIYSIPLSARGDVTGSDVIAWSRTDAAPYVSSPVLYDGTIYFTKSRQGIISALDAATGEVIIEQQRLDDIRSVYASPVAVAGRVYFTGRDGTTMVIRHAPGLEVLATNSLGEPVDASPVLVDDDILIRGADHLFCLTETP